MRLENLLFTAAILLSNNAMALPEQVCSWRADLVASAAVERDKGTKKKVVVDRVIKSLGPKASGFSAYIDAVYARPDFSPKFLRKMVYDLCLDE